jgi:hypothetical protein
MSGCFTARLILPPKNSFFYPVDKILDAMRKGFFSTGKPKPIDQTVA